ncbi:MAG TPA: CBS domain-containing protein [bacterium]|nr:CBS domain-containing protein [bacterium]
MKVRHAMSRRVLVVRPDDAVVEARRRMGWAGVRHLPVVDPERGLVGMIGGRDLLPFLYGDPSSLKALASDVMRAPVVTAEPDEELSAAAERMSARGVGALAVVDGTSVVGILTVADVLAAGKTRRPVRADRGTAVGALMTPYPVFLREAEDLRDAVSLMLEKGVRHLPVVDFAHRVVGVLSERDLRGLLGDPARAWNEDSGPVGRKVSQVMTTDPATIEASETLAEAARRFMDERVDALVVVDHDERLVGMLSWLDVIARMRPPEEMEKRSASTRPPRASARRER